MKSLKQIFVSVAVFISRLKILPANVSLVGAFGFFSSNPLFFGISILAYDYLVGGFYQGFLFNYLGFFSYWLIGRWAAKNFKLQLVGLPLASLLFFLISNFGVWLYWYPRTTNGLITCYLLAVPFYRNTMIGDLIFGYGYLLSKFLVKKFAGFFPAHSAAI